MRIGMKMWRKDELNLLQGVADIDDEEKRVRESEGKEVCKMNVE